MKLIRFSIIFSLSLIFNLLNSYSQINLQPGYILKSNNKDTIFGFIDYRNNERNPNSINFYSSKDGNPVKYAPTQISQFAVLGEKYISQTVTFDRSPYKTNELREEIKYNFIKDTVFLLCLMEGPKSLYYLMDSTEKEHFFIHNNEQFDLLLYKQYLGRNDNHEIVVYEQKKYIGQLLVYLQDCKNIQSLLKETKYTKKSLTHLFTQYYQITNQKYNTQNKTIISKNEFGLLAGLSVSSLKYYNGADYFKDGSFSYSFKPSFGIFYNINLPRNFGRYSICNQLIYYSFESECTYNQTVTTKIGLNYLLLNSMFRYKYPIKNMNVFGEAGAAFGLGFNETNYQKFEKTNFQNASEGKAVDKVSREHLGVNLGTGISLKNVDLEIRYMFGFEKTDYIKKSAAIGSKTNALSLTIGYHF